MRLKLTTPRMGRTGGLVAAVLVAGCAMQPFGQHTAPRPIAPPPSAAATSTISPAIQGNGATTTGAQQACIGAGRERNLDVVGVVGSSSATDTNGELTRDVMLRVRRNGSEIELRCNYSPASGLARIMLI